MPAVSIIIVNYNTFKLTQACIASIFEQTQELDIEVILVDNNSTDVNPDEFKRLFPQITLIKNPENSGFAKGNNLGIAAATGEYILLLNSDAALLNNAIFIVYQFLKRNNRVAVAAARLQYPNGRVQHNCQRFPSVRAKLFELLRLQKFTGRWGEHVLLGSFFKHDSVAYPDWVWGTFFMFRKALLHSFPNHKLPETFFMYGEDMEWCMEFRKRGYTIAFIPEAQVMHHLGQSGGTAQQWIKRNNAIFLNTYYSALHRWALRNLDRLLRVTLRSR